MRLTRRDAVAALAAAGVAVGGGAALLWEESEDGGGADEGGNSGADDGPLDDRDVRTLVAAAEVLYPSAVTEVGTFVERYVRGRADDRPDHAEGMARAVAYLDDYAEAWYDERFGALDPPTREEALQEMGADAADPDPAGGDVERVRYYVVNELLFALYATPTGGELVGLENPQGHPGGFASYRRGPGS